MLLKIRRSIHIWSASAVLSFACSSGDEVARVPAPSAQVDAVLLEWNGGATTSFGYEVFIVPHGQRASSGIQVAALYGAVRNDSAYGVNLKWPTPDRLVGEYAQARQARVLAPIVNVGGERVRVSLRSGVRDSAAPGGGMLYNLGRGRAKR